MIFFLILLLVSSAAVIALFAKDYSRVKSLGEEEISSRLDSTKPFWSDLHNLFVVPTIRVHQERVRPTAYKEIEKMARRFRIVALRVECLLMRFTEYIRGKRTLQSNGHKSHYWEQLNNCKNGTNGNSGNGNESHSDNPTA